ncbi:MAG: XrtA system polysaccharide chain length determinant [Nitrospirota bacterium]
MDSFPIYQYIEMFLRRKWWFIITSVVIMTGVIIYALLLPDIYRSTTLILVEPQKVPQDYVKSVVTGDIQSRLNTIRQQILSRTLLKKIVSEFGLYKDKIEKGKLPEDIIDLTRKNIEIKIEGRRKDIEAFRVSFTDRVPTTAMLVTNKLASLFIEENLKIREELVEGASEFLNSELKRLKKIIERQENAISDFKHRYMGELPEQLETNLRTLDRLQLELTSTRDNISLSEEKKSFLEDRLNSELSQNKIASDSKIDDGMSQLEIPSLRLKLTELKKRLTELRREYKDRYPDIILLKKEIKKTKERLGFAEVLGREDIQSVTKNNDIVILPDTQAVQNIKAKLNNEEKEITKLKRKESKLSRQIKIVEERVENIPKREQELMILMRDYNNTQKNYQSLLDKKLNADISENLEKRQKGEKFRILDPANLPARPYKPNRLKIILMGILFGLGSGGGIVFLLEVMNPSFKSPEEISEATNLPILTSIPIIKEFKNGNSLTARKSVEHIGDSLDEYLYAVNRIDPMILEQYRILFTKISELKGGSHKVIGITSSVKDEGKTLTSLNFGTVMSQFDKKILIIEGDLKDPMMENYLGLESTPGLTDFLSGKIKRNIIKPVSENLHIITAGNIYKDASVLLSSKKMKSLIEMIRNKFDYIIIDLPPILSLADVNMSLPLLDGIILVIRYMKHPKDIVLKAISSLPQEKIIGVVLNETDRLPSYYYSYVRKG